MAGLIPFSRGKFSNSKSSLSPDFWDSDFVRGFFSGDSNFGSFNVDVKDMGDHYEIKADIPGVEKENINVTLDDGILTISANEDESVEKKDENYVIHERRVGSMTRSFSVGEVKAEEIDAQCKDGVLSITLPKLNPEEKTSKKIDVK